MKKNRIGIFVEGTFLPSYEGATQRFVSLAENLSISNFEVVILHCYRGWSDMNIIKEQQYTTYFIPPDNFYNDISTIEKIIEIEKLEIIIMSNYEMILQIGYPIKCKLNNIKLIFEVHDISYDYNSSINPTSKKNEIEKKFEYLAFNISDLCFCFNYYDKKRIDEILNEFKSQENENIQKIFVIPFGITFNKTSFVGVNLNSKNIIFLGNNYHTPNLIAVKDIYYKILPIIKRYDSNITFFVVGDTPNYLVKECQDKQIKFLGKIENLDKIFYKTTLAISPIFYGSGIKVKVLEYCQAGIPILCSSQSLRGIINSDDDILDFAIEDNIDNYGNRILELLNQPQRLFEMSNKMDEYVKKQSWSNIINQFNSIISACNPQTHIKISDIDLFFLNQLNPYFLDYYYQLKRFKDIKIEKIYKGGFGNLSKTNLV